MLALWRRKMVGEDNQILEQIGVGAVKIVVEWSCVVVVREEAEVLGFVWFFQVKERERWEKRRGSVKEDKKRVTKTDSVGLDYDYVMKVSLGSHFFNRFGLVCSQLKPPPTAYTPI